MILIYLLVAYCVLVLILDWLQTRAIAKNPSLFYEMNPILGKHPTIGRVNVYFAACILGYLGMALTLPALGAFMFSVVIGIVQTYFVYANYDEGIPFDNPFKE